MLGPSSSCPGRILLEVVLQDPKLLNFLYKPGIKDAVPFRDPSESPERGGRGLGRWRIPSFKLIVSGISVIFGVEEFFGGSGPLGLTGLGQG